MAWTIADYRAQYAAADVLCQEVQSFVNEAGIPAINELRNAGHHFLKAIGDDGSVSAQSQLDSAINHVRRACYEATEAGIVFAVAIVKKFKEDFALVELTGIVPRYVEKLRECNAALRLVDNGRQDGFDRDQDHGTRIDAFRKIRDFVEELELARPEAIKKLNEGRRVARRWTIQIAIALLAIISAASFAIWASTGYYKFWAS